METKQRCYSHLLRLCGVLIVVVVVVFVRLSSLVGISFFCCVRLFLLLRFKFAQSLPLLGECISLRCIIGDDDVIEDGAALDLPQIEANEAEIIVLVKGIIVNKLRVCNLLRLPDALVGRVGNALDIPIALVGWIVLHRRLPLAVLLIIPVIWLLGVCIDDALFICPIIGLLVIWVVHHGIVGPVRWFLVIGIGDLLRRQKFPILLQGAIVNLLLINLHPHSVVSPNDQ